jgi:hypothetical protein
MCPPVSCIILSVNIMKLCSSLAPSSLYVPMLSKALVYLYKTETEFVVLSNVIGCNLLDRYIPTKPQGLTFQITVVLTFSVLL